MKKEKPKYIIMTPVQLGLSILGLIKALVQTFVLIAGALLILVLLSQVYPPLGEYQSKLFSKKEGLFIFILMYNAIVNYKIINNK